MSQTSPFAVIRWAQRQPIKNPVHGNVLVAIATYCDAKGVSWPSQEELAAAARYGVRAVRMALAWLEREGYLRREERRRKNGSRQSDRIVLLLDPSASNRNVVPVVKASASGTGQQDNRNLRLDQPARDSGLTSLEEPRELPKEESSEPIGSGTGKPAPERKLVFSEGRQALIELGLNRKTASDVIVRWLRETENDAPRVLGAIRSARERGALSPIPWITAQLKPRSSHVDATRQSEIYQAFQALAEWRRSMGQPTIGDP